MRYLFALALASCIPAPTPLEQRWPPPLGVTVEAVTSGDLDGDGQPEVLVYSTGDSHQAGIYAIEGHDDLSLGAMAPVARFTTFVPLGFTKPMAAAQGPASDGTARVFTTFTDSFNDVVVDTLSNQYVDLGPGGTDLPTGNAFLWLRPVRFPGGNVRVVVGNGSMLEHTSDDGGDVQPLPAPTTTWSTAVLAATYTTGADAWTIVVATPTELWRAPIPTADAQFVWTQIRSGPAWVGQAAIDLDGDGREEIVGLDLAMHAVCAIDVVKATPSCVPLGTTSSGTEITIVAAHVAGTAAADLVVAQATAADTTISVIADVDLTTGVLVGTTMAMAPISVAHGRAVVVNGGVGTPEGVLVFGSTGNVSCAVGGC